MAYTAFLCYLDDDDDVPEIKFTCPDSYLYRKIIPISFSVLHSWSDKDVELYK